MSEPSVNGLLTVQQTAHALRVSTKTIRRMIAGGKLVTHRFSRNLVRVDANSVARLLAGSSNGSGPTVDTHTMTETNDPKPGVPRLLRQRGRSKVWTAWVNFQEVPLGTTDEEEAQRRLAALVEKRDIKNETANAPTTHSSRKRSYRVYPTGDGGFIVKYYDADGVRRSHSIPADLPVPVTNQEEAEAYADVWYTREIVQKTSRRAQPSVGVGTGEISPGITFREFGQLWTSGELARQFPDHVKEKKTSKDDGSRLKNYIYPLIGDEPLRRFAGRQAVTLVERVLEGLPPVGTTFSRASRRQVIQIIHRLMTLAVYPAKILTANPLPKGFLPKLGDEKAKAYLFPDEDAKLMACSSVPLEERMFYGVLDREGMRVSELLGLTWADVDLERGVIYLDENKTDEPRSWALDPGVLEALRRWKERVARGARPTLAVLGGAIDSYTVAERLREHLKEAGVTRSQLFESSEKRIPIRAHDLRASFVTVNLAAGKSEAWITDRTGHKSSQMLYRYKRAARTHLELSLGVFKSLVDAIPELGQD